MTENAYYAEWGTVLTGLALGALTTDLAGYPTDRARFERAVAQAWPEWDGREAYPHVLPRDFGFYAERGILMQRHAPASWEWTHGIRPVLAEVETDAGGALGRFAASQPVGAPAWQELARLVTAGLPAVS